MPWSTWYHAFTAPSKSAELCGSQWLCHVTCTFSAPRSRCSVPLVLGRPKAVVEGAVRWPESERPSCGECTRSSSGERVSFCSKKGGHLPQAYRECAQTQGFPPVLRSFVTDRDPPLEFTINRVNKRGERFLGGPPSPP